MPKPVIGLIALHEFSLEDPGFQALEALLLAGAVTVRGLVLRRGNKSALREQPNMSLFEVDEISAERFLRPLDGLVVTDKTTLQATASAVLNAALRRKTPIIGRQAMADDPAALEMFVKSLPTGLGGDVPGPPGTVLFMTSNGTGLGHLTRQLAIGEAGERYHGICPVFITMSKAYGLVRARGWPCEYLVARPHSANSLEEWNTHLADELRGILRYHRPSTVVYDGNILPSGLFKLINQRHDVGLVWVRRGMWPAGAGLNIAKTQRYCDLLLEPSDLAEAADTGVTMQRRDEMPPPQRFEQVPPVTIIGPETMLDRREAREALGIDPDGQSILISLGQGSEHDLIQTIDVVSKSLDKFPEVKAYLGVPPTAAWSPNYWPNLTALEHFPLAQYFRAFDTVITAAGYNTMHELAAARVPGIYIPRDIAKGDRQEQRAAEFARLGFGRCVLMKDLGDISEAIGESLAAQSKAAPIPNGPSVGPAETGAARAARLIALVASKYATRQGAQ